MPGGRPHRVGQDGGRRPRGRPGPGPGPEGLLHHPDQGPVQPEVRRPAGPPRGRTGRAGHRGHHGQQRRAGPGDDHRGPPQHALRPLARRSTAWGWSSSTRSTTSRTATGGRCGRRSSSTCRPRCGSWPCRPPSPTPRSWPGGSTRCGAGPSRWSRSAARSSCSASTRPGTGPPATWWSCRWWSTASPTRWGRSSTPPPSAPAPTAAPRGRRRYATPRRLEVVEHLEDEDLLPAICFVFSRRGCDDAARGLPGGGRAPHRPVGAAPHPGHRRGPHRVAVGGRPGRPRPRPVAGRAGGRARRPPRRDGAAVQGGGRGLLRPGPGQGGLRHRDPRPRHQHAGPVGGDRDPVQVHRRAARAPHPGPVHPAHRTGRTARHRRGGSGPGALEPLHALPAGRRPGDEPPLRPALGLPARPTTWPPTWSAATDRDEAHRLLDRSFAQFQADRGVVRLRTRHDARGRGARAARGRGPLRARRRGRVPPAAPGRRAGPPGVRRRATTC